VNDSNLIPVSSESEAREKGRRGGIASGEARRRKRSMRDAVEAIMSMPLRAGAPQDPGSCGAFEDLEEGGLTVSEAIVLRLVKDALSEDARPSDRLRAVRALAEICPAQKEAVIVRTADTITYDEAMRLLARIDS
jgi:hypothetical protein